MDATERPELDPGLSDLAALVQARCLALGVTVGTAESCTGGLVAAALTSVPGSSGYVVGGIVAYADRTKERLLGVAAGLLARHGAVSAEVATAMAVGARDRLGVDLAVAVTGVSGPDGGSTAKPVGLTFVAVADAEGSLVERHVWPGDRAANRRDSAEAALRLLLGRLGGAGS